ncbi:hypothetical protein [Helicobacter cetorum]|uniref:hypothetical protein n=1 Tax=Helicobacter cetorum TaxID=138563 RepID=UPI000CF1BB24|nr:hypothetical protein [Helicobacter cetorum]
MIEVSEIISKVRARLNDNEIDNYLFKDSVLIESLNQAILNATLEFRMNKEITSALLTEEERFLNIPNLIGIQSAKLDNKELANRTSIPKDKGEVELLVLGDRLSVSPFKAGELEVIYFTHIEVNNILETINLPKIATDVLVYSVISNVLEIPTNENNLNLIASYRQLLKLAKDNLTNYLNAMYSKNIHFSKVIRV